LKTTKTIFLTLILLVISLQAFSQDTISIMTYNLLFYNILPNPRDTNFRKVMLATDPDIIVANEVTLEMHAQNFLNNVLNYYTPGKYLMGTFVLGPDANNVCYYKANKFTFILNYPLQTVGRNINMFLLNHAQTNRQLIIFGVHLKAGSTTANQQQRVQEVAVLRQYTNSLPNGTDFIVLGDFNVYSSTEVAYQNLLAETPGTEGHFIDAITMVGTFNQYQYRFFHTQSTRTRALPDGGSTGGLDDRFDMILFSKAVSLPGGIVYLDSSMVQYGNDGNHYNDSINRRPNTAVPDSIADALHYGSDHLPVIAKFIFYPTSSVKMINEIIPQNYKLEQNFPNPFNSMTNVKFEILNSGNAKIIVYDLLGKEVITLLNQRLQAGSYKVIFDGSGLPSGMYFYKLTAGEFIEVKKMLLLK